jgi:hypothetical protein
MTFAAGEAALSEWMAANAFVTWTTCKAPWELERQLINELCLVLNLDQNRHSVFHARLTEIRRATKQRARELSAVASARGS